VTVHLRLMGLAALSKRAVRSRLSPSFGRLDQEVPKSSVRSARARALSKFRYVTRRPCR